MLEITLEEPHQTEALQLIEPKEQADQEFLEYTLLKEELKKKNEVNKINLKKP